MEIETPHLSIQQFEYYSKLSRQKIRIGYELYEWTLAYIKWLNNKENWLFVPYHARMMTLREYLSEKRKLKYEEFKRIFKKFLTTEQQSRIKIQQQQQQRQQQQQQQQRDQRFTYYDNVYDQLVSFWISCLVNQEIIEDDNSQHQMPMKKTSNGKMNIFAFVQEFVRHILCPYFLETEFPDLIFFSFLDAINSIINHKFGEGTVIANDMNIKIKVIVRNTIQKFYRSMDKMDDYKLIFGQRFKNQIDTTKQLQKLQQQLQQI
jgi:hypothetical protein